MWDKQKEGALYVWRVYSALHRLCWKLSDWICIFFLICRAEFIWLISSSSLVCIYQDCHMQLFKIRLSNVSGVPQACLRKAGDCWCTELTERRRYSVSEFHEVALVYDTHWRWASEQGQYLHMYNKHNWIICASCHRAEWDRESF